MKGRVRARADAERRQGIALIRLAVAHAARITVDGDTAVASNGDGRAVLRVPAAILRDFLGRGLLRRDGEAYVAGAEAAAWFRRMTADVAPFLHQHGDVGLITLGDGSMTRAVLDESPLAWLARRKGRDGRPYLEPEQFAAGERLRRDATLGALMPRMGVSFDPAMIAGRSRNGAADFADATLAARERVSRAMTAIGPDAAGVVLDVCGFLKGLETVELERQWPRGTARVFLQMGLKRLAAHYGLEPAAIGPVSRRDRVWRAADARPRIGASG